MRYANGAPVFRAVMPPATRAQATPPGASRPVHFRQASRQPSSPSLHLHFPLFPIPAAYGSRSWSMPRLFGYAAPQVKESVRMVAALQSPGSRRSVAPHRLCAPQPPLYSPALPRGCNRPWGRASRRPVGWVINTRSRRSFYDALKRGLIQRGFFSASENDRRRLFAA